MGTCITAKVKRTLKAGAVVLILAVIAFTAGRPFVPFVPFRGEDATLDRSAAPYMDLETERTGMADSTVSDSELEDRAGRPVERVVQAGAGDTLMDLLLRTGVEQVDATGAIEALRDLYNPRNLKAGQKVTVTFDRPPHGLGVGDFNQFSLFADPVREVMARRRADKSFAGIESKRAVTRQVAHYAGTIKSSLFESATTAGVPAQIIVGMIRALSYDVDFQRDIHAGDTFDVLFEGYYDTRGKLVRHGDLLYAAVNLSGVPIALVRYEDSLGGADFYTPKGESVKKALLRTPVDGAKISSGFGMRNHPILGYSKMHKGVDFAVPVGTPIMSAGDGTVEMAGPNGAYGNYVRVRHTNGFATAYAHMSRLAQGVHVGKRVSQGQIVGFVGSTGRATGPHLHYEVLSGNNQINPMSIKVPTGVKLAGRELDRFQMARRQTETLLAKIPPAARVATTGGKAGAAAN